MLTQHFISSTLYNILGYNLVCESSGREYFSFYSCLDGKDPIKVEVLRGCVIRILKTNTKEVLVEPKASDIPEGMSEVETIHLEDCLVQMKLTTKKIVVSKKTNEFDRLIEFIKGEIDHAWRAINGGCTNRNMYFADEYMSYYEIPDRYYPTGIYLEDGTGIFTIKKLVRYRTILWTVNATNS